jgi:hypothetical protein
VTHSSGITDGNRVEVNKIGVKVGVVTKFNIAPAVQVKLGAEGSLFLTDPQPASAAGSNIGFTGKAYLNAEYNFPVMNAGGTELNGYVKGSASLELNDALIGGNGPTPLVGETNFNVGITGKTPLGPAPWQTLTAAAELGLKGSYDGSQDNLAPYVLLKASAPLSENILLDFSGKFNGTNLNGNAGQTSTDFTVKVRFGL